MYYHVIGFIKPFDYFALLGETDPYAPEKKYINYGNELELLKTFFPPDNSRKVFTANLPSSMRAWSACV